MSIHFFLFLAQVKIAEGFLMANPFQNRERALSGPASDLIPVTPSDTLDMVDFAIGLYVGTGGTIRVLTVQGQTRTFPVTDFSTIPVGVRRVFATGTTATNIFGYLL